VLRLPSPFKQRKQASRRSFSFSKQTMLLRELPPILWTVFVLRDIEGLTIDQTAEVLNVNHTAVTARLWRGRLRLRERLNEYFSEQTKSARAESSSCKTLTDIRET
jgi:DNA-directed RNA polymerase specialized sigma24 family protein